MKGFLFAAYFVNMVAAYLAHDSTIKQKNRLLSAIFILSIIHIILATIFTINLLWSDNPWITNSAPLLWFFLIFGIAVELLSLFKKNVPGQLLAASIHLFLVMPTLFSIGIFVLVLAIAELLIAFILFYRTRHLWA